MNNYTKLLVNLVNVNIKIEEEDKAMILLLPDEEHGTFILTFINSKQILNYSDVSATLINYEVRKKNRQSSSKSDLAEALTIKGRSFSKKDEGDPWKIKVQTGFQ